MSRLGRGQFGGLHRLRQGKGVISVCGLGQGGVFGAMGGEPWVGVKTPQG